MSGRVVWERSPYGYQAETEHYTLLVSQVDPSGRWTWEVCARLSWYDASGAAPDVDAAMREAVRVLEELSDDG